MSTDKLMKNPPRCHPEEPQAVLSDAKEGSRHLLDSENAGILRFAQNDSLQGFFISPLKALQPGSPVNTVGVMPRL